LSLTLVLLVLYCALQVAIGTAVGRRVRTSGDFFVAGRTLGPGLLFATLVAANIGGGSTVGAAGLGYRDGLAAWWWAGSAAIGSAFLAFGVGPRLWRVAADHDLRTVGDYLEHRYSRGIRGAVSGLLWLGTLAILAGQLIALAWILNVVAGVPKWIGCLAAGTVLTLYFAAGGLLTSAWVNIVQVTVKAIGFALALPMAIAAAGGWSALAARLPPEPAYWSAGSGGSGLFYLALLGPAFVVSPGLLQKVYGARDARAVRIGVGANAAVLLLFAAVPPLLGMAARSLHPSLVNGELALPVLLAEDLPPFIGALGLAAVVSAELSAADAVLFMLSTSLSQDLYRRFLVPAADDRRVLAVARGAALFGGAAGTAIAIAAPSVIGVLGVFYTLLTVSLFVPIVGGLFVPRLDTPEAGAAIAAGVATAAAGRVFSGEGGLVGLSPPFEGLLAAAVAAALVAVARRRRSGARPGT
jgi:solute:Na+ symporter, SSS family